MIVYAESNFLLELAFLQEEHGPCRSLMDYAEAGRINLVVPAYCLGECLERLERRKRQRTSIQSSLQNEIRELGRSARTEGLSEQLRAVTEALVRGASSDWARYDDVIGRLLRCGELIPLDAAILARCVGLRGALGLSPQDAVVMASVLADLEKRRPTASVFANKNRKDFENPDIQRILSSLGCELKTRFRGGLAYLESALKAAGRL